MSARKQSAQLQAFIDGSLRNRELQRFIDEISESMRHDLEYESAVEGFCYTGAWLQTGEIAAVTNSFIEADYTEAKESPDLQRKIFTEDEYRLAIEQAYKTADTTPGRRVGAGSNVDTTMENDAESGTLAPVMPFDKHFRRTGATIDNSRSFLIAAALICTVAASTILFFMSRNKSSTETDVRSTVQADLRMQTRGAVVSDMARYDSVIESSNSIHLDKEHQGLVQLGKKTVALAEPHTRFRVEQPHDSLVNIDVAHGTVSFSVEKGRYRKFTVVTPTAQVRVTGTIFRVTVGDGYTMVVVDEGSVELTHRSKHFTESLSAGQGAMVNVDSILQVAADNIGALAIKRDLLRNFLESSITEEPIIDNASKAMLAEYRQIKWKLLKNMAGCDSLVYQFARRHRGSVYALNLFQGLFETHKESGNFNQALSVLAAIDSMGIEQWREQSLFWKGFLFSRNVNDTIRATGLFISYINQYPRSDRSRGVLRELITILRCRGNVSSADSMLESYLLKNGRVCAGDTMLFEHGHFYRLRNDFESALVWFERLLDLCPSSSIRADAAYWASYSVVQRGIRNTGKRALFIIKKPSATRAAEGGG